VNRRDLEDLLADAEARRAEIGARIDDLKRQLGRASDRGAPGPSAQAPPHEAEDLSEPPDHGQTLHGRETQEDDPEEGIAAEIEDLLTDPKGVHSR
jgi:hypothetical protein